LVHSANFIKLNFVVISHEIFWSYPAAPGGNCGLLLP